MKKAIVKLPTECGEVVHHMQYGDLKTGDVVDVPSEMDFAVEQYFFPLENENTFTPKKKSKVSE